MPIKIDRRGDFYTATVSPPHGNGTFWSSPAPMTASKLIDLLRDLWCHTTDITDALYEADPFWLNRLKESE